MHVFNGTKTNWMRTAVTATLACFIVALLYIARKALLPFALGALLAYLIMPLINWVEGHMSQQLRAHRFRRGMIVLVIYALAIGFLVGFLAFVIPPIAAEVNLLIQRLPELAGKVYSAAPETPRVWLERYNELIPADVRLALQRQAETLISRFLSLLQAGALRTIGLFFSTLSFVLGLIVVPLWTFYVLRDLPEFGSSFFQSIPPAYREDAQNILELIDSVVGAYLRGQLVLCLSVGLMFTVGLLILGIDFALLLGVIAGILEIIPVLGPILGAIPAVLVALATSPSRLLWVLLLAFAVQQAENALLVPQITGMSVKLHPALVMVVLIIGSALAGVGGIILSVPLTAVIRDVAQYLYLRLADEPLSPREALTRVRAATAHQTFGTI